MTKRRLLLIVLTLLIFTILIGRMDFAEAWVTLRHAKLIYLWWSFLLMCTFPLWSAVRWNLIVRRIGARLGFRQSFIIIMAAWPMGTVTPAKSGDLIKLLFLKNVLPYSKTTGVILAERMMDLVALTLCGTIGGWLYGFYQASLFAGLMLCGVIAFFIVAASPLVNWAPEKWRGLAIHVLEASKTIYLNTGTFFGLLFITLLNWFGSFLQTWCCYRAFGSEVPLGYIVSMLPIAIFIGLIPVTLSGMGTRDSAIILLFQKYASYETNLAVGILYSIFGYWLLAVMGIPFLRAALGGNIQDIQGDILRRELHPSDRSADDLSEPDRADKSI